MILLKRGRTVVREYFKRFKHGGLDELPRVNFVGSEARLDLEQLAEMGTLYGRWFIRPQRRWHAGC